MTDSTSSGDDFDAFVGVAVAGLAALGLFRAGRAAAANYASNREIKRSNTEVERLLCEANLQFSKGNHQDAVKNWNTVLRIRPSSHAANGIATVLNMHARDNGNLEYALNFATLAVETATQPIDKAFALDTHALIQ